ncbi:MAG: hypothetical protein JNK87_21100 [Bryobacterales bacterium]|nr:hypothetical protein [Bryobacterales bacterium]
MYSGAEDSPEFLRRLSRALAFTDKDLSENRQGRISNTQMARVSALGFTPFLGIAGTLAGLLLVVLAIAAGSEVVISKVRWMLTLGKPLVFALGTLFFGFVAVCVKFIVTSGRVVRLLQDMAEGKVTSIIGRGTPSKSVDIEEGLAKLLNLKKETHCLVVRGEYFEIPPQAHELLMEREATTFRVYVTPRSRYMVSLEIANAAAAAAAGEQDYFQYRR